jgi:hypothetical protein
VLRQVLLYYCIHSLLADLTLWGRYSYDLDLDTRLSEETTVLVENYTVRLIFESSPKCRRRGTIPSCQTVEQLKSGLRGSRHPNACSNLAWLMWSNLALQVRFVLPDFQAFDLIFCDGI